MTIREFLNNYTSDVDIIDNYADDFMIAWCGTNLTDIGRITYKSILDLQIEEINDCLWMVDCPTSKLHRLLKQMFYGMAGYCPADDWDKLFYDHDC